MLGERTYREETDKRGKEIGTLFLVATPLGNRDDMSPRAAHILEEVAYVAAEDTRTAARLLSELGVGNRLISYYEQNQHVRHETFLRDLLAGRSIAVISEAGMPCISDPGEGIVRLAVEHGIPISVIPGPSAFVSAVAASGFDTRRFVYEGFIPARGRERRMLIKEIASERRTVVFYEAPHRIEKTFRDLVEAELSNRRVVIARELTKRYEEFLRLTVAEAVAYYDTVTPRGEFTIVLEGADEYESRTGDTGARSEDELVALLRNCFDDGMATREAAERVSAETGVSKNDLYRLALSVKDTH
ncbi:MAG TPA: 16S rRNA (cytidine(1402)-2'-O)-methyltransferase [Clostridiaceae bacterium]|nr:16S rRNA (cytidine(1402)-2'-O)-methyltransferase [Clostridiaceae bacterium]